jgi:hypothetical protein
MRDINGKELRNKYFNNLGNGNNDTKNRANFLVCEKKLRLYG